MTRNLRAGYRPAHSLPPDTADDGDGTARLRLVGERGFWTLIWGWINAGKHNIRNLMLIWTVLIVLCVVLQGASMAALLGGLRS